MTLLGVTSWGKRSAARHAKSPAWSTQWEQGEAFQKSGLIINSTALKGTIYSHGVRLYWIGVSAADGNLSDGCGGWMKFVIHWYKLININTTVREKDISHTVTKQDGLKLFSDRGRIRSSEVSGRLLTFELSYTAHQRPYI